MQADYDVRDVTADQVSGLDVLELAPARDKGALSRRIWRSAWPKLLAVVLVVAAWELVVLSGWKPEYVLPAPATVFGDLKDLVVTGDFWDGVRVTMLRAVTGFALAVLVAATWR